MPSKFREIKQFLVSILLAWIFAPCLLAYQLNSACTTGGHAVVQGTCKKVTECPSALSNLRAGVSPSVCYHENGQPVICCQSEKRISGVKCDEYTKQIIDLYSKTDIQPFLVGSYEDPAQSPRAGSCTSTIQQALISGGRDATSDEMSFTVALGYIDGKGLNWRCGGTLINEDFLLTAAHCVDGLVAKPPTRVLLGDKRLNKLDSFSTQRRVEANVQEIYIHPDYKKPAMYNDLALIKLDKKVKFSRSIQPACLPRPEMRVDNLNIFFSAGWGHLGFGEKQSDVLQVVDLTRYPLKDCNNEYGKERDKLPEGIVKSQICAGDKEGEKDTCQGDSGGPLTAKKDSNGCMHYLMGITSFGSKFCGHATPAIYTNVQSYLDWIEGIAWGEA